MSQSPEQKPLLRENPSENTGYPHFNDPYQRGVFVDEDKVAGLINSTYNQEMEIKIAKLEVSISKILSDLSEIRSEVLSLRLWIAGSVLTFIAVAVGLAAYQSSWFQHSLTVSHEQTKESNEKAQKTMERIDATMLRLERMDAERQHTEFRLEQMEKQNAVHQVK